MAYYVRRLPHWHPANAALFVTWRLFGSLPRRHLEDRIRLADDSLHKPAGPSARGSASPKKNTAPGKWTGSMPAPRSGVTASRSNGLPAPPESAGQIFVQWDRQLDKASGGPLWLRDPRIAQCVVDSLRFGEAQLGLYQLRAWVVMPNHVHVLWMPQAPLSRITRSVKWFAARRTRFWDESDNRFGRMSPTITGCETGARGSGSLTTSNVTQ